MHDTQLPKLSFDKKNVFGRSHSSSVLTVHFQNIFIIHETDLKYHAAFKVEFQPFNRSYSQLTFFNFLRMKYFHH